jgi:hypothetical protein
MPPWFANPMPSPGRDVQLPSNQASTPDETTAATLITHVAQLHSIFQQ